MFSRVAGHVSGRVAEVGAGIGTFSERLRAAGASELLLIEPEPACAAVLRSRYDGVSDVTVAQELLPDSPALAAWEGRTDLVLCQNVLEHIPDDATAMQ